MAYIHFRKKARRIPWQKLPQTLAKLAFFLAFGKGFLKLLAPKSFIVFLPLG
jgi:hypothetical protein